MENNLRYIASLKDKLLECNDSYDILMVYNENIPFINLLTEDSKDEIDFFIIDLESCIGLPKKEYDSCLLPYCGLTHESQLIYDETMRLYKKADKTLQNYIKKQTKMSLLANKYKNDPQKLQAATKFIKKVNPSFKIPF